jgi:hypothetical protein
MVPPTVSAINHGYECRAPHGVPNFPGTNEKFLAEPSGTKISADALMRRAEGKSPSPNPDAFRFKAPPDQRGFFFLPGAHLYFGTRHIRIGTIRVRVNCQAAKSTW